MKYDLITELASKGITIYRPQANALRTIFATVIPKNVFVSKYTSYCKANMELPNSNQLMINFEYAKESQRLSIKNSSFSHTIDNGQISYNCDLLTDQKGIYACDYEIGIFNEVGYYIISYTDETQQLRLSFYDVEAISYYLARTKEQSFKNPTSEEVEKNGIIPDSSKTTNLQDNEEAFAIFNTSIKNPNEFLKSMLDLVENKKTVKK